MTAVTIGDVAYAHSREGEPPTAWEPLKRHLRQVAELASQFAGAFGSREWGAVAGLWHDVGKYKPEFQARLRGAREQVEHAGVGAALAHSRGGAGVALAFAIAGHHAGMANREAQADTRQRPLRERLTDNAAELDRLGGVIPSEILKKPLPSPPPSLQPNPTNNLSVVGKQRMWSHFIMNRRSRLRSTRRSKCPNHLSSMTATW